jgi:integrase
MASYLQKRRLRWYAVLEIPVELRKAIGRVRFVQSLKTDSYAVAQRRAGPHVLSWKHQIAKAKGDGGDGDDAAYWQRALHEKTGVEREALLEALEDKAYWIGAVNVEHIGTPPTSDPGARQFYADATALPLLSHIQDWLNASSVTARVGDRRRAVLEGFAATFATVQEVTRAGAQRWVAKLLNEDGLTPGTVRWMLSVLRIYWRFLQSMGAVGESNEPFSRIEVGRQNERNGRAKREHFGPSDVVKLLRLAEESDDPDLADLIRLGMWSGARIEELCSLRIHDVH